MLNVNISLFFIKEFYKNPSYYSTDLNVLKGTYIEIDNLPP